MTNPRSRNIAASIHQRLLDKSKESIRPFNELFQYYAIERFLYRLSRSSHTGKFILKGALMFLVWEARVSRSTMDIDMLGRMKNSPEAVIDMFRELCLLLTRTLLFRKHPSLSTCRAHISAVLHF